MKKRNIYKDLVWLAVFCALIVFLSGQIKAYLKEQKSYGFYVQSGGDLTREVVEEFQKFSGILSFQSYDSAMVTVRLGRYTLETELLGLDLKESSLQWKTLQPEISLGNTPALFLGTETFLSFTDPHGYSPTKGEIEKWMEQYDTLELVLADEYGHERKAKLCGILQKPQNKICMDKNQMQEVFGKSVHTMGGYMEIYGYQNMEKACRQLQDAGFLLEKDNL